MTEALRNWLSFGLLFLLLICGAALSHAEIARGTASIGLSATITYDEHGQASIGYDNNAKSCFGYDALAVFASDETKTCETESCHLFVKPAEFLAAEGGTGASLTQVSYGEGLSTWSQTLRYSTGNFNPAGNAAVFQYVDEAGETQYAMGYAQRFTGHSETVVGNGLLDMGVQPSQVTGIYTEFAPCPNCATYLQQTFPNVPVSYSFPLNAAGKAAKAAAFSGF